MAAGINMTGTFIRKDDPVSQLPEKPLALNAKFFRELVRRIETIVPKEDPEDPIIKVSVPDNKSSPGLIIKLDAEILTLNVCSGGNPATIKVYGVKEK